MTNNKIEIDETYCKGCALCTIACPHGLIEMDVTLNSLGYIPAMITPANLAKCTACALCARTCPDTAITVFKSVSGSKTERS
ncbi:MAG: ferredoxin family protein [Desulfuromonadales bacterium]|nr:ferredoxin family protein [Desulfuromonadales bacterium]